MKVQVDRDCCQGHAMCNVLAPDVFGLYEEDGHSFVKQVEWTPENIEAARRAEAGCPEGAITVTED